MIWMYLSKMKYMNTFSQKVIQYFDFQIAKVIKLVCWNNAHYKLEIEVLKLVEFVY